MHEQRAGTVSNNSGALAIWAGALVGSLFLVSVAAEQSAGDEWVAVKERWLAVEPGSILDFSPKAIQPIKESRRMTAKGSELLVAGRPVHLMIADSSFLEAFGGFPDHDGARRYADEIVRRGYNMVSLVGLHRALLEERRHQKKFKETIDRLDYLLAQLKRRGVYWELDVLTKLGKRSPHSDGGDLRYRLYFDESAKRVWKDLVDTFLLRVNRYTGIPILKDPALAMVTLVNENDLFQAVRIASRKKGFLSRSTRNGLNQAFRVWLAAQKGGASAIRAEEGRRPDIFKVKKNSPDIVWVQKFCLYQEEEMIRWMTRYLRGKGYRGLISGYNNDAQQMISALPRVLLDVVSMHAYHDHAPVIRASKETGPLRKHHMRSSLDDRLAYVRKAAIKRLHGKPFIVDEYNHAFPNPWRREAGIVFPAMAAYQGWNGIARFSNPIVLEYGGSHAPRRRYITTFNVGMDPVARAGEVLSFLLFKRGDVSTSASSLVIDVPVSIVANTKLGWQRWPAWVTNLALGNRIATLLSEAGGKHSLPAGIKIVNLLKPGSHSGLATGHPDQLGMDFQRRLFRVATASTEAACFDGHLPVRMKHVVVSHADGPALVSVSSMDGQPIHASSRMLMLVVSDARNSGMKLHGGELEDNGRLPVLISRRKVTISLEHARPEKLKVFALDMTGRRVRRLSARAFADRIHIEIDNVVAGQPRIYFEISDK